MVLLPVSINKIPSIYEMIGNDNLREFVKSILKDNLNVITDENNRLIELLRKKDYSIFDQNFNIDEFLERVDNLKETLKILLDNFKSDKDLYFIVDELYTQILKLDYNINTLYSLRELENED